MKVKDFKVNSEPSNIVLPCVFFYLTCNLIFIKEFVYLVFLVHVYLLFC